jgi:hypothetical protein
MYVDGKVYTGVGVIPLLCGPKTHLKTSYSKHGGFFVKLALFFGGGDSMCCSNVGAKFRSQHLSHMMPNLGGSLFLRTRWRLCTTWLDRFGEKRPSAHVSCSMEKDKSPKMASCGPSNFKGDGLHLNLLKKNQMLGSSSLFIHLTYYDKVVNFLKKLTWPKWSLNKTHTKIWVFSSCP